MKTLLKIFGVVVLIVVLVIGAVAIAVHYYVTPERLKPLIENHVRSNLHREIKLGDISVGVFSGLAITNVALSENPDFSRGTFVSADKIVVQPQLLPLLQKKIFVRNVALTKPNIRVVRFPDGKTFNFSSLVSSSGRSELPQPSAGKTPSPYLFLVSKAVVENGRVIFEDQSPAAQSADVSALNLSVKNITLTSPIEAQTDFRLKTRGIDANIGFMGKVNPFVGSAAMKQLTVRSGGSSIIAHGDVKDATSDNPAFDLKIKIEKLDPALLRSLGALPTSVALKDPITGDIAVKGTTTNVDTTFVLGLAALRVAGQGTIKNATSPNRQMKLSVNTNDAPSAALLALAPKDTLPADLKLGGQCNIGADIDGTSSKGTMTVQVDGKALDVAYGTNFKKPAGTPFKLIASGVYALPLDLNFKRIEIVLNQMLATGYGTLKSVKDRTDYQFTFRADSFALEGVAPLVPPIAEYNLAGRSTVTMNVKSAPKGPDVKGNAQIAGGSAMYSGLKISNIASTIDFTVQDVAGKLTADQITHTYMTGQKLMLSWNLKDATDLAKIAGTANLRLGPGEIQNIQKLTADVKAARVLFYPITMIQKLSNSAGNTVKLPAFDRISYKTMQGDYAFKNGTMNVSRFDLDSTELNANMKGTIGLTGQQPLNLVSILKLPANAIGGTIGDLLNDEQGRATLKLLTTGTVAAPDTKPDLSDASKKAINAVKEKYGDQIMEQGQKLLKGLFNR